MAGCNCEQGASVSAGSGVGSAYSANESRVRLARAFNRAWPSGMPYPPLAPWIGSVISRQAVEAAMSRSASSSVPSESRSEIPPYGGTTQWDQALCDNPITMALLVIIVYWASMAYCEENDCEYVGFEIDPDTCTLTHVYCECPGGGGGGGGNFPKFDPWLAGLIDQFLKDQDDFWTNHEHSGNSPEGGW